LFLISIPNDSTAPITAIKPILQIKVKQQLDKAIKIREKYKPAYSVLYPATNSASASDKSNGALLVSAIAVIIKIKLRGNKGTPL